MAVSTGTILAIVAISFFVLAGVILAILAATGVFNSSPPTDTHESDDSKNKNKHKHDSDDSDHSDDSNEQVDDCKSDDDCKDNSTKKTCNNNDCENTKLNNKCVVKKCTKKDVQEVHLCKSDDDCKNNLEKKTCDVDCADKKGNNKCVFNACTGIKCETNSDCADADNTYKTVCDLKKKVCDFNKSIIITGTNGKSITVDPKYALNEKGYKQTQVGCFSLDNQSDWQDALKDNTNYCKVKSITLPPNIKATTYYTNGGWDDICSKDIVETISGPNVVDRKTKDTACGFKFEKVKNV